MKRLLLLLFLFLSITCSGFAQTQQGIVKTRGRVVNGKVVSGTKLVGVTITLSVGNPQVSQAQGAFSFNIPAGKSFSLVSAKKNGYTLADPEYTRRTFMYSASNPFYVILEDEAQLQADIKVATDKVRKTLKRELRKREDELDELREANAITQAKYDSLRAEFAVYRQSSEALVNELAERFAAIDYDQLDDFNRQVQQYIEDGELLKADSLINTRGSLEERYARVKEQESVNTQREEEIRAEQESLSKSQKLTQREKKDLMSDLYAKHAIYLQAYQQDSALYCLKMRADLDTTNVDAVGEYAYLCHNQYKFSDSEKYYHICLRAYTLSKDFSNLATIQNNLGNLYLSLHDYENSEKYSKLALENRELLFKQNPDAYREGLAITQYNLGLLYGKLFDNKNSQMYFELALENQELLCKHDPEVYRAGLASTQSNLAILYSALHDYENSEKYFLLAFENKELLFKQNPEAYRAIYASAQNNLGSLYYDLQDYDNSEKFYKLALENYNLLFKQNPDAYRAELAGGYNNLGNLYSELQNYENSEKYYNLALSNYELLVKQYPEAYREDLAQTYWNVMFLYYDMNNLDEFDRFLALALESFTLLEMSRPSEYINDIIELQIMTAYRMLMKRELEEAMALAQKTYAMDDSNEGLAEFYNSLAYAYTDTNISDFENAQVAVDRAISMFPDNARYYDSKGEILLMQGLRDEALEMWNKVQELDFNFLDNYPDGTNLSNGLKKLGLIE